MKDKRRDLRSWRNKVAAAKYKASRSDKPTICHLCREPIDLALPYKDRMAFTLDHLEALAVGGHINGPTLPAHRSCNSARGKGDKEPQFPTTQQWY